MFELFTNPFAMMAGAALVASPIIIHLINRMRFKRIRWAAMEFLLKAQKRTRRKAIIEQLILLLLRVLLMVLIGLLLARFGGCNNDAGQASNTIHVIILDDTASMGDVTRGEDGVPRDAFADAKRLIAEKILPIANQATGAQYFQVFRLSKLDEPLPRMPERVNPAVVDKVRGDLNPLEPVPYHVELLDGLERANKVFDENPDYRKVLHVVSDFRAVDWGKKAEETIGEKFKAFGRGEVEIHLLDVASPERGTTKSPLSNDNLAIVDLRADSRIAVKDQPVDFTVDVKNNSSSERKAVRVSVRLNGSERAEGAVVIPTIAPNAVASAKFTLLPNRSAPLNPENDEQALEQFSLVSATWRTSRTAWPWTTSATCRSRCATRCRCC